MNNAQSFHVFVTGPTGQGKSLLGTMLKLQGIPFVEGPVHTDAPAEFDEAEHAAHDIAACLPQLHDTVLEATGKSLDNAALLDLLQKLPAEINEQINDWGLADTGVREQIYAYLQVNQVLV